MSEQEEESLNIKRPPAKARVEHCTFAVDSTLPQYMLGVSPGPQKPSRRALFFGEQAPLPKARNSSLLLQGSFSVVSGLSQELSSGSQFTFPTRRLSTIPGSEESTGTLHQTALLPETSGREIRDSEESLRKSQKMVVEPGSKHEERPLSKVSVARNKIKRNFRKNLVEKRVREWELRQLINIEEARTHELVVEEV